MLLPALITDAEVHGSFFNRSVIVKAVLLMKHRMPVFTEFDRNYFALFFNFSIITSK